MTAVWHITRLRLRRIVSVRQMVWASLLVFAAAAFLVGLFFFAQLRVRELEYQLVHALALRRLAADTLIVARYRQWRAAARSLWNENAVAEAEALLDEQDRDPGTAGDSAPGSLSWLVGFLAGKTAASHTLERTLFQGYLAERHRQYARAAAIWAVAFPLASEPGDRAFVLLHQGFCLLLNNEREKATEHLLGAVEHDPDSSAGRAALALLLFEREGRVRFAEIAALPDGARKAELFYGTGDFTSALQVLQGLRNPEVNALFLEARIYEELGHENAALAVYAKLLEPGFAENWRTAAARRVVMLKDFYGAPTSAALAATEVLRKNAPRELEALQRVRDIPGQVSATRELSAEPAILPVPRPGFGRERMAALQNELRRARLLQQLAGDSTSRATRDKILQASAGSVERFYLRDQNTVLGIVVSETAGVLTLLTAVGKLQVPRDQVVHRESLDRKSVVRSPTTPGFESGLLNPALSRTARRAMLQRSPRPLDRLLLEDGNEYTGLVLREAQGTITLVTVVGTLEIPLSAVRQREKIAARYAFAEK